MTGTPAQNLKQPQAIAKHRFVCCIAGIVLAASCCLSAYAQAPTADPNELWAHAAVYRDEWGVPHIQADSLLAMAFAFGYAQADDHIEGMLRAYRVATGRAAEVYGEDYALSDEFALKMGHGLMALQAYPFADAVTRDLCEGFALGVNAWIVDHPGEAPDWAEGVRPEEILALLHCYLMSFAPFELPGVYARPPAAITGNAWAVAPARSTTGETLLAINPHTDYVGPFQWYEAQLSADGFSMSGATIFGLPMLLMGHNGVLGWALTPNQPDIADVFIEPDPEGGPPTNPGTPRVAQAEQDVDTMRYLMMVANAQTFLVKTPGGVQEHQVPYLMTPRGPIIGQFGNRFCSYMIGGYQDFGALSQLVAMGDAQNLEQFQQALLMQQLPCFHILYADKSGNLFYLYNAKVGDKYWPEVRPEESEVEPATEIGRILADIDKINWLQPVDGSVSRYQWGPTVAVAALPAVTNPPTGYLQACGNQPWWASGKTDLKPEDWPEWFILDGDSFRSKRVRRMLALGQRSFEDCQDMLYDVLVPAGVFTVPRLMEAADAQADWVANAHPDLPAALDILKNWNYVADAQSEGMTLFHVWWAALRGITKTPSEYQLVEALQQDSEEVQAYALRAAEEAAKLMRSEFQTLNKPWGDVHVFTRGDKSVPAPGAASGEPIFIASDFQYENGLWKANYGYGFGMVVAFGDQTRAVSMVPFGSSEVPSSPHFADQLELLKDRRMKPARFYPDEVRRYAKSVLGTSFALAIPGLPGAITVQTQNPVTVTATGYTQPPAPLPLGMCTFTVYAQVQYAPYTEPIQLDLDIPLPPELCADENLARLALHAYDTDNGWQPIANQTVDPATRTFSARDRRARVYAILGPEECRPGADPDAKMLIAQTVPTAEPMVDPNTFAAEQTVQGTPDPAATAPPEPTPQTEPEEPGVRRGAIAWGRNMQLHPPGMDGMIEVSAEKAIGARLIVSEEPPHPLPEGLAAFTETVAIDCSQKEGRVDTKVNLRTYEGVCAPENLDKLSVYVLDESNAWSPLTDQRCDPIARTFSAIDSAPRTYAVLGPVGYLQKRPREAAPADAAES